MNGEMVVWEQRQTLPTVSGKGVIACSYDLADPAQRGAALRAVIGHDVKAMDSLGEPWPTEHVVVKSKEVLNEETGEVEDRTLMSLIRPDGQRLLTQSRQAIQNLREIISIIGPPPWNPPQSFKLVEMRGGKFGRYYVLEPC